MGTIVIFAAAAFAVGFAWGFRRPAGYCHLSTVQRHALPNRASSGLINGVVFAGIVGVIAAIAVGSGL
ncbi:hypothetical protein [Magnetospira sp. QH-2]|uniref:hypothetical protein n=1 Tax=Magnetospira sp. (strain QH-2) TaxID=1288970 RepID=UPI0003E80F3A|nr:hypothetical protein [Magnetospira sp. QH-2]CCQ72882.1 exported protein of unknown function [Magnetospira sp. QH-2]